MSDLAMRPDADVAQAPSIAPIPPASEAGAGAFGELTALFAAAGRTLTHAQTAETAFAAGHGGLQEMVFERARADAILNVASATATKAAQSLNTILNMQV